MYLNFDPLANVEENANRSFNHFTKIAHLDKLLNPEELELFRERFVEEAIDLAERDVTPNLFNDTKLDEAWKADVARALEDQKPVASEKLAVLVNRLNLGWTAAADMGWLRNLSAKDSRSLCGVRVSNEDMQDLEHEKHVADSKTIAFLDDTSRIVEFDARQWWPQCAGTIDHVRDQGQCGDCWAMATAGVIESRLCITSNGSFSGPAGFISGGYIASCGNNANDGCSGGFVSRALRWAAMDGVPTGGRGSSSHTCVPYFASGNSLDHFSGADRHTPDCPTECTNNLYPRSITEDKFFPEGMAHTKASHSFEKAREAIRSQGPIAVGLKVYSDFMSYKSGIYKPSAKAQYMGMHATTAIGYGPDYILGINSWDRRWGSNGSFKIHHSAVLLYWLPGAIVGFGPRYPYPLPGNTPIAADSVSHCFHDGVMYMPLDMQGQTLSKEARALDCQSRCKRTPKCAYFAFFRDKDHAGDCHLQNESAIPMDMPDVVAGPATCEQATAAEAPSTTTSGPSESSKCWRPPGACVESFTYNGSTYSGCTTVDHGSQGWCSHTTSYQGHWSNCIPNCEAVETSTTAPRTSEDCWEPVDTCVDEFNYQGRMYKGCTTAEYGLQGWCSYYATFTTGQWAACIWRCGEDDKVTKLYRSKTLEVNTTDDFDQKPQKSRDLDVALQHKHQ
jgi:cathepsin B